MKKVKRFLAVLLSVAVVLSLAAPAGFAAGLSDIQNSWAKKYIEQGISAGYISGYGDGTFRPNASLTRGAFCKLLNKALGLQDTVAISFSDVSSSNTFYTEIQKAVYAGYISGYTDGTFRPAKTITRQEAAVMISRVITNPTTLKSLSTLSDSSSIATYAQEGVQKVLSKGYITGDESKKFNPSAVLTRAQTCKIISLMLAGERIVKTNVTFTTAGKTYSNNVYTGQLTSSIASSGTLTFDNCRVLGKLSVSSAGTVQLSNSRVVALSVVPTGTTTSSLTRSAAGQNISVPSDGSYVTGASSLKSAAAVPTIIASGSTDVASVSLSSGATLTESGLTSGSGFNSITLSGSGLSGKAVTLRGAFTTVNTASPSSLTLASGSIAKLNVDRSAAGSAFALTSGTNVAAAALNGSCAFTGAGTISAAEQNISGVTFETRPVKLTGTAASSSTLTPTVTPASGSTGISTSAAVKLVFSEAVLNSAGGTLTAANVVNNAVELRKSSATGTKISYTAAVSADKKTITLTPSSTLDAGSTYYVVLLAGGFKSSAGAVVARQVFSFTTVSGVLTPTVSPSSGSTGVSPSTSITLTFSENVYTSSGTALTSSYLYNTALELRSGSETGSLVGFSANINSASRVLTLYPSSTLSSNTRYYLILKAGMLRNSAGTTCSRQVWYFNTTGGTLVPTVSPSSGSTGISTSTSLSLTFSENVYTSSGTSLTSSYLYGSALELRSGSETGSLVGFSANIASSRVLTLYPSSTLSSNTRYYLILKAGMLRNSAGTTCSRQVWYFNTTGGTLVPTVSPSNGSTGISPSTSITMSFGENVYTTSGNSLSSNYLYNSALELRYGSESGSLVGFSASISSNRTLTLYPSSTLAANTRYYLILKSGMLLSSSGYTNDRQVWYFNTTSSTLTPSVSPSSGSTGVSTSSAITLTFGESVYTASGNSLTSSYLYNSALELRSGSTSGSIVNFSASISSNNRVLTLYPSSTLTANTRYYIILKSGMLLSSSGYTNSYQEYYFNTASTTPTVSMVTPSSTSGVSTSTQISLNFNDLMYTSAGGTVTDSYIANSAIQLRLGSSSGTLVNCSASVSTSGGRTYVTLTPTAALNESSIYCVYVQGSALRNSSNYYVASTTFTFTTGTTTPTVTALSASPTLDGATVNLTSSISGTATVSMGSKSQTVTVTGGVNTPVSFTGLDPSTSYTVTASVADSSRTTPVRTITVTTSDPTISITATPGKTDAVLSVGYNYSGTFTISYTGGSQTDVSLLSPFTPSAASGTLTQPMNGLTENTQYTVTVIYTYGSANKTITKTASFTTAATSTDSSLASFHVQTATGTYSANLSGGTYTFSTVTAAAGSTITVTAAAAAGSKATVSISGDASASGSGSVSASLIPALGDIQKSITVTVTAESGAAATYTFIIPLSVTSSVV